MTSLSRGIGYSGSAVKNSTLAPASRAYSVPAATAFAAVTVPSVGIRMWRYMVTSLFEDQGVVQRRLGRVLDEIGHERDVLALLGGHLAGERAQSRVRARPVNVFEEDLRALLGVQRDGERLARRHQPVEELARPRFRRAVIEPLVAPAGISGSAMPSVRARSVSRCSASARAKVPKM